MPGRKNSALTLIELAVSFMILALVVGITIPVVRNHVSNQKLKNFAQQLAADLAISRQEAIKTGESPAYSGESSPESPTDKVWVNYKLVKGERPATLAKASDQEILFSFQGFTGFSDITGGTHLDFYLRNAEQPAFSIVFNPDGTPVKRGKIFLSNGMKTFSVEISPTGNVKFKED